MPDRISARYRARDGTEHRVLARRTPEGRWQVLDRAAGGMLLVETLTGHDDRLAQAEALARDYAAEQQAYHDGERLEDPLPEGPFDLVFSALAVHHLDARGKADLFARVAAVLEPGGWFVLADVVVPDDPADATTPLSPDYDLPDRVDEQLAWLRDAGLEASVVWAAGDLAVDAWLVGFATFLAWRAHTVVDVNLPTLHDFRISESRRMLVGAERRLGIA